MKTPATKQNLLEELISKARSSAGDNLEALVLYGSAAGDEFDPDFSDLNVLCLVKRLDAAALKTLGPVLRWWRSQAQPDVMLFSHDELRAAADVFAIELHDIKARHRMLIGPDVFQTLTVPMQLHQTQVERELRQNTVKLRHGYVQASGDHKSVLRLLAGSVSTFLTLFRHALIAFGDNTPHERREVVRRAGIAFGFDPQPLEEVLQLREQKKEPADPEGLFASYLDIIERVTSEVDRRLA
jgi:hypothetical protein